MRKFYFLFATIFLAQFIYAQTYVSFPVTHAQWNNVRTWYDGGQWGTYTAYNYQYIMNGDTTLNGIEYNKMFNTYDGLNIEYIGGLREDTEKNIYFFPGKQSFNDVFFPSDTTEYLLYTFNNLEVGSILSINDHNNITVLEIDSVLLGETYHKRYFLTNTSMGSEYWIEGVGSDQDLFSPYSSNFEWLLFTLCFKPDSLNTYYINSPDGNNWCYFYVGTNDLEVPGFIIYPNPANEKLNISGQFQVDSKYIITNITGSVLLSGYITNDLQLSISNLKSGVYCLTISSNNQSFNSKFIKL